MLPYATPILRYSGCPNKGKVAPKTVFTMTLAAMLGRASVPRMSVRPYSVLASLQPRILVQGNSHCSTLR